MPEPLKPFATLLEKVRTTADNFRKRFQEWNSPVRREVDVITPNVWIPRAKDDLRGIASAGKYLVYTQNFDDAQPHLRKDIDRMLAMDNRGKPILFIHGQTFLVLSADKSSIFIYDGPVTAKNQRLSDHLYDAQDTLSDALKSKS